MATIFNSTMYSGLIFIILSFLLGSIPFGLIYSLIRGTDIRKIGSGNIGATNVGRQFGFWGGFIPITILDMAKGMLGIILFRICTQNDHTLIYNIFEILIGVSAVLGHVFSPWLGFKGGKGVATTGGMIIALSPIAAVLCVGIFLIVFFTFGKRIVGRASIISAICFPIIVYFIPNTSLPFQIMAIIIAVMIVFLHRKNIQEWISGEDLRKKNLSKTQV